MDVIKLVVVIMSVLTSTSGYFLSTNANFNNVIARDINASVIVENKALNPNDLLCDDGNHPGITGICADGSHPLVIRADPLPVNETFMNNSHPATTKVVSLCADRILPNSTTGKCHDGSLPLRLSTEDLTCTNAKTPSPNGTCTDGTLPLLLNEAQNAMTVK